MLFDRISKLTDYLKKESSQSQGDLCISIGSSILAQGNVNTGARWGNDAAGPCEWAMALTNQRLRFINKAVSGQTTSQMLDRLYEDVLKHKPALVIAQNGTNENGTGFDSIKETSIRMYDQILDNGSCLGLFSMATRDKSESGWDDDNLETQAALNEFKRRYAESHDRCFFIDVNRFIVDPESSTGEPITGVFRDGTHWSPRGAFRAAQGIAELVRELFAKTDPIATSTLNPDGLDFVYGNELPNPSFRGTGGSLTAYSTGVLPDDWRINYTSTSSGSVVSSVAPISELDLRNQVQMTFTPGGASGKEQFLFFTAPANISPDLIGEYYEALLEIEVDAWDGWTDIALEIDDQSEVNKTYYSMSNVYDLPMPEFDWKGILRTPEVLITGDQRFRLRVGIDGQASGTGTLRINSPVFRPIDPDTRLALPRELYSD